MFKFLWLRKLVRRHTRPIPYRKAVNWRNRLSILYAVCAWNAFGWILWEYSRGRGNPESYGIATSEFDKLSPAQQYAIRAGVEKAKIIRSSNMSETVEFNLEDYKKYLPENQPVVEDDDEDNVA